MAQLSFGKMIFTLDGEKVAVDMGGVNPREWRAIKAHTGFGISFFENLDEPLCVEALYWLALDRAGRTVDIDSVVDLDDFAPLAFLASVEMPDDKGAKKADDAAPLAGRPQGTRSTRPASKAGKSSKRANGSSSA